MRLKVLTTAFVIFTLLLLLGFPLLVGPRPHLRPLVHDYILRYLVYLLALMVGLVGAGVCSILVLRAAREEYRREKEELLRQLLEASLQDHLKQPPEAEA